MRRGENRARTPPDGPKPERGLAIARWHALCSKKRVLRLVFTFLFSGGVFLLLGLGDPSLARASVELSTAQFKFVREVDRTSGEYPLWVNRDDCLKDDKYVTDGGTRIEITPRLSKIGAQLSLQVWVGRGADCTDLVERQNVCWNVLNEIARVNNTTYTISPRDIIAAGSEATDATCDIEVEWATTLFVMLFDGDSLLGSTKWEQTQVDTRAPAPPTNVSAEAGDDAIYLSYDVQLENEDVDSAGFQFYCTPGMVVEGAAAGLGGAGGESGGPACVGDGLTPGALPSEEFLCSWIAGPAVRNAPTGLGDDLAVSVTNGTSYAVGVAATDYLGNVGRLSALSCATPEPVITFFEHYRGSGGRGGGGYCSMSLGPLPAGAAIAALLSGLVPALAFVRRRRRS